MVIAGYIPAGYIPAGYIPAGYIPAGYIPAGYIPAGYIPAGYIPAGYATAAIDYIPAGYATAAIDYIPAGYILHRLSARAKVAVHRGRCRRGGYGRRSCYRYYRYRACAHGRPATGLLINVPIAINF